MPFKEIWLRIEKILLYIIFFGFFFHGLLAIIFTFPWSNCDGLRFLGNQSQLCGDQFSRSNFVYGVVVITISLFFFRAITKKKTPTSNPSLSDSSLETSDWGRVFKIIGIILGFIAIFFGLFMIGVSLPRDSCGSFAFFCSTKFILGVFIQGLIVTLLGIIINILIFKKRNESSNKLISQIGLIFFRLLFLIIMFLLLTYIYGRS